MRIINEKKYLEAGEGVEIHSSHPCAVFLQNDQNVKAFIENLSTHAQYMSYATSPIRRFAAYAGVWDLIIVFADDTHNIRYRVQNVSST